MNCKAGVNRNEKEGRLCVSLIKYTSCAQWFTQKTMAYQVRRKRYQLHHLPVPI